MAVASPSSRAPRAALSLDAVAIFVEVVRAKSFSEAARRLGLPKSTVSVRISELEARLGVALLLRTTRKVQATPAGEAYFAVAARSIADLRTAEVEASHAQAEPSGIIRITSAGVMIGNVSERITEFLALYPQVSIEHLLSDQAIDLLSEGVDVAFRIGTVADDPNLTARRIGSADQGLYASSAYLRRQPAPAQPKELDAHVLLLPSNRREVLLVRADGGRATVHASPRFVSNHPTALRHQALRGQGIALLPTGMAEEDVRSGTLRRVLGEWTTAPMPVSLVYATQRYLPHRVRLFVDSVLEKSLGKSTGRSAHRSSR